VYITLTNCYVRRRIFNAQDNRMTGHRLEVKLFKPSTFNFKQQLELEETRKGTLHYMKHLISNFKLNPCECYMTAMKVTRFRCTDCTFGNLMPVTSEWLYPNLSLLYIPDYIVPREK